MSVQPLVQDGRVDPEIPSAQQIGIAGHLAHIYETQVAIFQLMERPENFASLAMFVLGNMEHAIRAAPESQRGLVQVQCQNTIRHYVEVGKFVIAFRQHRNRSVLEQNLIGFGSRLANDMVLSVAEASRQHAHKAVAGDAAFLVKAATEASLNAIINRFAQEGEGFFRTLLQCLFDGERHEGERRRWLFAIEALLQAASDRRKILGPSGIIADIGAENKRDIIDLHVLVWKERCSDWTWWYIWIGVVVGLWIVTGLIIHGIAKLGWSALGFFSPSHVAADAGSSTWAVVHIGIIAAGVLVAFIVIRNVWLAVREILVVARAEYRIGSYIDRLREG